jgi:hypothetical protein
MTSDSPLPSMTMLCGTPDSFGIATVSGPAGASAVVLV